MKGSKYCPQNPRLNDPGTTAANPPPSTSSSLVASQTDAAFDSGNNTCSLGASYFYTCHPTPSSTAAESIGATGTDSKKQQQQVTVGSGKNTVVTATQSLPLHPGSQSLPVISSLSSSSFNNHNRTLPQQKQLNQQKTVKNTGIANSSSNKNHKHYKHHQHIEHADHPPQFYLNANSDVLNCQSNGGVVTGSVVDSDNNSGVVTSSSSTSHRELHSQYSCVNCYQEELASSEKPPVCYRTMELCKSEIDKANKDKQHKLFNPRFKVSFNSFI